MGERWLYRLAWIVAIVCVAPIVAAALTALGGDLETWRDVLWSVLPRYVVTTLTLVVIVGCATAAIGTGAAWFVTVYRFPFSRFLEAVSMSQGSLRRAVLRLRVTSGSSSTRRMRWRCFMACR